MGIICSKVTVGTGEVGSFFVSNADLALAWLTNVAVSAKTAPPVPNMPPNNPPNRPAGTAHQRVMGRRSDWCLKLEAA